MKKIIAMASVTLVLNACGNKEREYDATGVFEATETTVYAEQTGALLMFNVEEEPLTIRLGCLALRLQFRLVVLARVESADVPCQPCPQHPVP